MSVPTSQHAPQATDSLLEACLGELDCQRQRLGELSLAERITLTKACFDGVVDTAAEWAELSSRAKGTPAGNPFEAEDVAAGPVPVMRHLTLLRQTFEDLQTSGRPQLPGSPQQGTDGRWRVPIFPARGLYDPLVFFRLSANAWVSPDIDRDNLSSPATALQPTDGDAARIVLVLGAGNVSSIPPTDMFSKLFQEGRLVLLKMNPVNDYLQPVFERAFAPLISAGYLRIISGGADVGAAAIAHELVDEVHVTGSIDTHDAIVWGKSPDERAQNRAANAPPLRKPITSELGNVSPWIVVPGRYSKSQLAFQAESIASSITNNCSFNCLATKVVVTSKSWPQREQFLDLVQHFLDRTPTRPAYYPGAIDRYREFTGRDPECDDSCKLPWTFLRDVNPDDSPHFFQKESFVCVCVETSLDADDEQDFLRRATDFANEELWGTLCAALTVSPAFRRANEKTLQECLGQLRYGAVGINHWPGLVYAMMTPPWGGAPGSTLTDAQSGLGWVHNTYMLQGVEKTVLEGPLTLFPKPFWFPTYRSPTPVAWSLFRLYKKPSLWNLGNVLNRASLGAYI